MEEMKITRYDHYIDGEDFDRLDFLLNGHSFKTLAYMDPVDDQHALHLRIDAETEAVIGAMILWANDWLAELADAFKRRDLNHPDVRFFFEQKIRALTEQWQAERAKVTETPRHSATTLDGGADPTTTLAEEQASAALANAS